MYTVCSCEVKYFNRQRKALHIKILVCEIMSGKLSTHVLNTVHGCPARNMKLELWAIADDGQRKLIKTLFTNRDGRTDELLLNEFEIKVGIYEICFYVSDYFTSCGASLPEPNFLTTVPVRFGIADKSDRYHVPLLVSPWAYSTYRGS
jgi:5-hydroxyisourate hydrolase